MKNIKINNTASFLIVSLTIVLLFSVMVGVSSADGDIDHASISDFVWHDQNRNGIQDDGEPGIPGVVVNLYICNGDLIDSTTTDSNGFYLFDYLRPGDYYIEFIAPNGYIFTPQNQGSDDSKDSDSDGNGITICTTLGVDEDDMTWDAGMYQPQEYCGCSHGFWKNHHDEWIGYTPYQALDTVFIFPGPLSELADDTLDDALSYGGGDDLIGGARILLRNAVASLLNAAHHGVDYQLTTSKVIDQVDAALASLDRDTMLDLEGDYDFYNNQEGCLCDEENDENEFGSSGEESSEINDEQENEDEGSNAKDVCKKSAKNHKEKKLNQKYACPGRKIGK